MSLPYKNRSRHFMTASTSSAVSSVSLPIVNAYVQICDELSVDKF